MQLLNIFKSHITGLTHTLLRYPMTTFYLIAIVTIRFIATETTYDHRMIYNQIFAALVIGFFISICFRSLIETLLLRTSIASLLLYTLSILLSLTYYLYIYFENNLDRVGWIRTGILAFGLLMAFLWIPSSPKESLSFSKSFMSGFKSFFITLFFSGVLYLGILLVIAAIDNLLVNVNEHLYIHFATLVFLFFAPIFYLSLIPNYKQATEASIEKATQGSRFLETLLSYIIIPLTTIFTLILFIYIITNIRQDFWTESLLEPMLVTYSIVVISVLLLSAHFTNAFAMAFFRIFPKLLIPIVLLQITASIMLISSRGITHGRYFVILYGIFALASGIIFSFFSKHHLGIIAILFVASACISALPPLDAFNVSRRYQIYLLEESLADQQMLANGQLTPSTELSDQSKSLIIDLTQYLNQMNYLNDLSWIPKDFNYYEDFEGVFGFNPNESTYRDPKGQHYTNARNQDDALNIEGYTHLVNMPLTYYTGEDIPVANHSSVINEDTYTISWAPNNYLGQFSLESSDGSIYLALETIDYDRAFYETENAHAKLKVIPNHVNLYYEEDTLRSINGDVYILIQLK